VSIKLKASYTTEREKADIGRVIQLLRLQGTRVSTLKEVKGKPYSRIYATLERDPPADKSPCGPPGDMVK